MESWLLRLPFCLDIHNSRQMILSVALMVMFCWLGWHVSPLGIAIGNSQQFHNCRGSRHTVVFFLDVMYMGIQAFCLYGEMKYGNLVGSV